MSSCIFIHIFTYICQFCASRWRYIYFCFLRVDEFFEKHEAWRRETRVSRKPLLMTANKKFASERIEWYRANAWVSGSFEINLRVPSISRYTWLRNAVAAGLHADFTCRDDAASRSSFCTPFGRWTNAHGCARMSWQTGNARASSQMISRTWREREERENREREGEKETGPYIQEDGLYVGT